MEDDILDANPVQCDGRSGRVRINTDAGKGDGRYRVWHEQAGTHRSIWRHDIDPYTSPCTIHNVKPEDRPQGYSIVGWFAHPFCLC